MISDISSLHTVIAKLLMFLAKELCFVINYSMTLGFGNLVQLKSDRGRSHGIWERQKVGTRVTLPEILKFAGRGKDCCA